MKKVEIKIQPLIVKWSNREIEVYFDDEYLDILDRGRDDGRKTYGYCEMTDDKIFIRDSLPDKHKRSTLWHELNHFLLLALKNMSDEVITELFARFVDEILSRNKWVRELY